MKSDPVYAMPTFARSSHHGNFPPYLTLTLCRGLQISRGSMVTGSMVTTPNVTGSGSGFSNKAWVTPHVSPPSVLNISELARWKICQRLCQTKAMSSPYVSARCGIIFSLLAMVFSSQCFARGPSVSPCLVSACACYALRKKASRDLNWHSYLESPRVVVSIDPPVLLDDQILLEVQKEI